MFPASDKCPRSVFLGSGLRLERFFPGGRKPLLGLLTLVSNTLENFYVHRDVHKGKILSYFYFARAGGRYERRGGLGRLPF